MLAWRSPFRIGGLSLGNGRGARCGKPMAGDRDCGGNGAQTFIACAQTCHRKTHLGVIEQSRAIGYGYKFVRWLCGEVETDVLLAIAIVVDLGSISALAARARKWL